MKVVSLSVHNFRSIEDATIDLNRYSLLVGPNNAGKSNLVAAIRTFYEKLKYDETRDFPKFKTQDGESWVEIQYSPNSEEWSQLKEDYKLRDNTFRVRKYFKSQETDEERKQRSGIYAYVGGKLSGSRFYGAKNVQQGKLGNVIYVPAVSKLDEHTKLTGPSALRDLLNMVLEGVLSSSKAYKDLSTAFSEFGSNLKREETLEGISLETLEEEITRELVDWGAKFELHVNPLQPDAIVKTLVEHQIVDGVLGKALEPSAFGDGFQRQLIFTLMKLAAQYGPKKMPADKKEFSPAFTWILFEEPEAFLHPPQIEILNKSLRTFSQAAGQQVLISSHSTQFASLNVEELPALVRLNREESKTIAGQIKTGMLEKLFEFNQEWLKKLQDAGISTTDEDATIDMESIKYALWLSPMRTIAFFAQRVLLVEGPSERVLTTVLLAENRIKTPPGGVAIVDTMGKWNTYRFMKLLSALRIPHSVLYDLDKGEKKDLIVEEAIKASTDSIFTKKIDYFDRNIEEFLGVPKASRPDRKPQHLMWYYKKGRIDQKRIDSLCEKLQALLDA